jgi:hypothetical protein
VKNPGQCFSFSHGLEQTTSSAHIFSISSKTRAWTEKIYEENLFILTIWTMFVQICGKICCQFQQATDLSRRHHLPAFSQKLKCERENIWIKVSFKLSKQCFFQYFSKYIRKFSRWNSQKSKIATLEFNQNEQNFNNFSVNSSTKRDTTKIRSKLFSALMTVP